MNNTSYITFLKSKSLLDGDALGTLEMYFAHEKYFRHFLLLNNLTENEYYDSGAEIDIKPPIAYNAELCCGGCSGMQFSGELRKIKNRVLHFNVKQLIIRNGFFDGEYVMHSGGMTMHFSSSNDFLADSENAVIGTILEDCILFEADPECPTNYADKNTQENKNSAVSAGVKLQTMLEPITEFKFISDYGVTQFSTQSLDGQRIFKRNEI